MTQQGRSRWWTVARWVASLAMLSVLPACGEAEALQEGLYLGDRVSFRLVNGRVQDLQLRGISCHIPNPNNFALVLCYSQPSNLLPDDVLDLGGKSFSGMVSDVQIEGTIRESSATGTWFYQGKCGEAACQLVQPCSCAASGTWDALYTPETDFDAGKTTVDDGGTGTDDAVLGPDPVMPSVDPSTAVAPESASAGQLDAHGLLAEIRSLVVVDMVEQTEPINAAAQAHAVYYSLHQDNYLSSNTSPHIEDPAWEEGFTGIGFTDRMAFQGAAIGSASNEIMAFSGTVSGAIDGWMSTLYHRIPLVHPNSERWGFGIALGGPTAEVGDFASGIATLLGPARWPYPGMTGVERSWNGAESPQPPLPEGESYPSGPIVTISFERSTSPVLVHAEILNPSGEAVPAQVQHPDNDSWLRSTWAIYPTSPLQGASTYTVTFKGEVSGEPVVETWSFSTQ